MSELNSLQKVNEDLTRVGPGTVMGELMRRYWLPALLSSELEPAARRCACCCWARSWWPGAAPRVKWV